MKIVIVQSNRAHALKRKLADRISPTFVEDLALNSEHVREGVYERIKDVTYRKRLKEAVALKVAELDE